MMSADIDSMAYVGAEPWHGLGHELPDDPATLTVYKQSGLDWRVLLAPSLTKVNGDLQEVPGEQVVVREDNHVPLGTVGQRYRPIQNRELFRLADILVQEADITYESAGSLGDGEEVFLLLTFDEPLEIEGDQDGRVERYFLIRSSHDGSHALDCRFTPIRVVCRNTLNFAVRGSKARFSIRHTESADDQLEQVRNSLRMATEYYDSLEQVLSAWTQRPFTLDQFITEVADELFPEPEEGERSGKAEKDREKLITLYEEGTGMNVGIRGTAYGALQAVTEFADHAKTFRSSQRFDQSESRMRSILGGSARRFKQKGFRLIEEAA